MGYWIELHADKIQLTGRDELAQRLSIAGAYPDPESGTFSPEKGEILDPEGRWFLYDDNRSFTIRSDEDIRKGQWADIRLSWASSRKDWLSVLRLAELAGGRIFDPTPNVQQYVTRSTLATSIAEQVGGFELVKETLGVLRGSETIRDDSNVLEKDIEDARVANAQRLCNELSERNVTGQTFTYEGTVSEPAVQEACIRFIERCATACGIRWRSINSPPGKGSFRWLHGEWVNDFDSYRIEIRESSTFPFFGGQLWPWSEADLAADSYRGPDFCIERGHFIFDQSRDGILSTIVTRDLCVDGDQFAVVYDNMLHLAHKYPINGDVEGTASSDIHGGRPQGGDRPEEAKNQLDDQERLRLPGTDISQLDALVWKSSGYWSGYARFPVFLLALRERFIPNLEVVSSPSGIVDAYARRLRPRGVLDLFREAPEDDVVQYFARQGINDWAYLDPKKLDDDLRLKP